MKRFIGRAAMAVTLLTAPLLVSAQQTPAVAERVDLDALQRIKDEGLQRSQVMDTAWWLTEVHGPRLTHSPQMRDAAAWAMKRMAEWGLTRVREEKWGPFGRGWTNDRLVAHVTTPQPFPLTAYARAWTPGTNGPVTADAILAVVNSEADFAKFQGKLRGKIVLSQNPTDVRLQLTPIGRRLSDTDLANLEGQPITPPRAVGTPAPAATADPNIAQKRMEFYAREGAVMVLEPGTGRSDHGAVLVTGPSRYRDAKEPATAAQLAVLTEQYNRLARLVSRDIPVQIELDVRNRFFDDTLDTFNIVAEIPGTDKADEVVMLGAHFDSWHTGTGATDNASGSAAMMEAMRILKASGVRLRRTVRIGLWTGEEQGLLGSAAYVKQQFADRATMALQPGHAKFSAYFNMDNGSGAIRGVYLQGNEAVRPIFAAWMEPFRNLGMTTLSIRGTGGTDHLSFDAVGLPGFQFIQDPLEYSTHSHHTNMDHFDRLQAEDLMKNAVIIASFAYNAANRDTLLPRKPLPAPPRPATNTTR